MSPLQLKALDRIAPEALACQNTIHLPAELSTAQCGLESGWLATMSGTNNCFGIKANPRIHGRELIPTHEWFTDEQVAQFLRLGEGRTAELDPPFQEGHRKRYAVRDWFAGFDTLKDCFAFHGALLQRGLYAPAWEEYQRDHDLNAYIRGIAAHYATEAKYAERVIEIAWSSNVQSALRKARDVQVPTPDSAVPTATVWPVSSTPDLHSW